MSASCASTRSRDIQHQPVHAEISRSWPAPRFRRSATYPQLDVLACGHFVCAICTIAITRSMAPLSPNGWCLLVCRVRGLRTEVDWGRKQRRDWCQAHQAIQLSEQGFVSVDQLLAGEGLCTAFGSATATAFGSSTYLANSTPAQVRMPSTVKAARLWRLPRGRGASDPGQTSNNFKWDTTLLEYDCPLFARKFPAETAQPLLQLLADCRHDLRVLPGGRAEAAPCAPAATGDATPQTVAG